MGASGVNSASGPQYPTRSFGDRVLDIIEKKLDEPQTYLGCVAEDTLKVAGIGAGIGAAWGATATSPTGPGMLAGATGGAALGAAIGASVGAVGGAIACTDPKNR